MNRINIFRKGDKVRITTWRGCVLSNDGYTQHPKLRYKIATVDASTDRGVSITLENGQSYTLDIKCVELVKPKKRTFKQITHKLSRNPIIKKRWHTERYFDDPRTVLFVNERGIIFHVYDDGEMRIETDPHGYHTDILTPEELVLFAAACQEIAAGRKDCTRHE